MLTLDEQLERKVTALRKYRGTVAVLREAPRAPRLGRERPAATSSLAHAQARVKQLTATVAVLRAKIRARDGRKLAKLPPRQAICTVFGSYCQEAVAVAWCESRLTTSAQNGQYRGLFQMGSYERSLFGHGSTAHDQARAAHRYFVRSGRDWSPWAAAGPPTNAAGAGNTRVRTSRLHDRRFSAQSAHLRRGRGFRSHRPSGRCPENVWGQRKRDRLRPLDEAAAYARCHGDRDDNVRIVKLPPRRVRYDALLSNGESIRRDFEIEARHAGARGCLRSVGRHVRSATLGTRHGPFV